MLDWTMMKTSLSLFQWFILEEIHFSLVSAKHESRENFSGKMRVNRPQSKIKKAVMGLLSVTGIFLLIFGPMLLFSSLNPIYSYNGITGGMVEMGIEFTQNGLTSYYPLFMNSNLNNLQQVNRNCTDT